MLISESIGFPLMRNMIDTTDDVPPYPDQNLSWKEWWEKKTGRKFEMCSCFGCYSIAEVGAHVEKAYGSDKRSYIVPLCKPCNNKPVDESFMVDGDDLVEIK